jgi:tetratricopeptide (TPR) repeat protein
MPLDPQMALQVGQTMLHQEDMPELAEMILERGTRDFGETAELLLLHGLIEHYRLDHAAAEGFVQRSIELEDSAGARFELGKIYLERGLQTEDLEQRQELEQKGRQQLRLAVDRDPNMVDAVALLVEKGWSKGLDGVVEELEPLIKVYPQAWSVWRVLGDAYVTDERYGKAIESYQKGLSHETVDQLLLPCLGAMEQAERRTDMLKLARSITSIGQRDPQLRWKVAQILCEHQKLDEARKLLQAIVDDEQVQPQVRQRADDVLDHLDSIERQQNQKQPKTRKPK